MQWEWKGWERKLRERKLRRSKHCFRQEKQMIDVPTGGGWDDVRHRRSPTARRRCGPAARDRVGRGRKEHRRRVVGSRNPARTDILRVPNQGCGQLPTPVRRRAPSTCWSVELLGLRMLQNGSNDAHDA